MNPLKHGRFTAGTHPLFGRRVMKEGQSIYVFAWNFTDD